MAKLEDLIKQIPDVKLRAEISREAAALKNAKKFGLVFEDHIPEQVQLPNLAPQIGARVIKRGNDQQTFQVLEIKGKTARLSPEPQGEEETAKIDELVVIKNFGEPIYPTLTPRERVERATDKPWHTLINADNFHALQLLLYCYEGMVDLIYIDPPYNKGARDWKYNNDYVDAKDQWRHSKWLAMMKRRLLLGKRLLKKDGVIVVTIDENEIHHLGMLLEEVFPEYLRNMVTVVINPKGTGKLNFARVDEYVLFCVPQTGTTLLSGNLLPREVQIETPEIADYLTEEESQIEMFEEGVVEDAEELIETEEMVLQDVQTFPFPEEELDSWELRHARRRGNESSYRHQRPNQFYAIYIDPVANRVVKVGDSLALDELPLFEKVDNLIPIWPIDDDGNHRCWRFIPDTMRRLVDDNRVILGRKNKKRETWTLNIWERKPTQKKVKTVWWTSQHDAGTHGTSLLHKILGRRDAFPFPKSIYAVRDTISTVCANRPDALILDFFAGSGTTLHATALLNTQDDGKRRCILVTNNEVMEKQAKILNKEGLYPGDLDFEKNGICESATWPRCKYIINGKRDDGVELPGSYTGGRKLKDGFEENLEYFRLDFLDPQDIAIGDKFEAILPILWLMAGAQGKRESDKGEKGWFIPKNSPFAVLVDEHAFTQFKKAIVKRNDLTHIFIVTDSLEGYRNMIAQLPENVKIKMLYKSYLDNFKINIEGKL